MAATLRIVDFSRSRHQLTFVCAFGELRFSTSLWYQDVDLEELERTYGAALLQRVYFHIVAFEINKLCSLAPETIDLGPFAAQHTREFEQLWREVFVKVWGQWRYENSRPSYSGPEFLGAAHDVGAHEPVEIEPGPVDVLAFCGGGKDSLIATRFLERVDVPYASLAYSSSIYGQAAHQHQLIDGLLDRCKPVRRHRQWIFDDFLDAPVLDLEPGLGVGTLTAAETPASIFASMPYALAHGYRYLCLAHEKSADRGNMHWAETGEEINHQWGKSTEAERLINAYLRKHLISNLQYFSILKPIHDALIFSMLADNLDAVPATHSCNVTKPWCKRCPKCAYVWLNYQAYLPSDVVDAMFGENLFDVPENQLWFRQMLGLESHTPFECIGEISESRLAFELCYRKGLRGRAIDTYLAEARLTNADATLDEYLAVDHGYVIPHPAGPRILDEMDASASRARAALDDRLRSVVV